MMILRNVSACLVFVSAQNVCFFLQRANEDVGLDETGHG